MFLSHLVRYESCRMFEWYRDINSILVAKLQYNI